MQDSRQFSISTKASGQFAVACIDKRLVCKSNTNLDIVEMEEQVTLSENLSENDFGL